MKNKGLIIGILVLLIAIGGYFVWQQQIEKTKENGKEVVKIGAILPLTGSLSTYGQSGKEGMSIAIEEFQKMTNATVKLFLEDDKGGVKEGVNAINKLIVSDNVQIIMGSMSSGVTLGIAPIVERNKVVLVAPTSTASEVSNAGDYIFRVCVSDEYEGKAMADYVIDSLKYDKLGILYINNDYGVGLKTNFKKSLVDNGKKISYEQGYDTNTTNFKSIVENLKRRNIDLLYIVAQKEQINFFKTAKELNYYPQYIASTMIEDEELLSTMRNYLKGTKYTYRSYDPNSQNKVSSNFVRMYKTKYSKVPDFYAASVYDATRLILNTITKTKKYKGVDLKETLYNTKNYEAVTGIINFDEKGDVTQGFSIKMIH